jgi:ubiquinone/menaquinone biosynthesis C-methylase UbiE
MRYIDWSERTETYNNLDWVNNGSTLDAMLRMAGNVTDQKVLDIGTGTGKVLDVFYSKYPLAEYYGLDLNTSMMSRIQNCEYKLRVGNVEDMNMFKSNYFDVVTARMVMHHVDHLSRAFNEIHRVLRPGGKLILCEGNPPDRNCINFYEEMFRYKEKRHTFLMDDLTNLYINAGFEEILCGVIINKNMSLNNWVDNSGIPDENKEIIKRMHYECSDTVKKAYEMKNVNNDITMTWKFSVICGKKVR